MSELQKPIWDRGEAIDPDMLRFTIGDDWLQDRRLIEHDINGSLVHAEGLALVGLIQPQEFQALRDGLAKLREGFRKGEWTVEEGDEDVHSAVERRLIALVGDVGKKLHTARSRNEQVALDVRLWLREASGEVARSLERLIAAAHAQRAARGKVALPGYTHLRRGMPSTLGEWLGAHAKAFEEDLADLRAASRRIQECPLGTGAGYGLPIELDRDFTARALGFERPEKPVTFTQHARGRAELAYLTALEGVALDLDKLAHDLWLFSSEEFGFVRLPVALTTGSSLMPQKRNPDLIELVRAHARQVVADRAALLDVLRDLPSGYHRDFQLLKPPLFRAHDRVAAMLPLTAKLVATLDFDEEKLAAAASDPKLRATERALEKAKSGVPFRDAYREESVKASKPVDD
ncbi:MAG: argininosuccinate lyase, partial [Planctomycetes bacterium]|nr:argininosuccinate lyase [Planctomycetota bacterium]